MFERERGAGECLGGELHGNMRGTDFRQPLADHLLGEFRAVAFPAEMAKVDVAQVGRHDFLCGIGGVGVGQMAVPAGDALLEAPRASGILQHLQIMVRFQNEDVGGADAFQGEFGRMAKVSQKADLARRGAEQKTNGIRGIVRNAESVHHDIANFKTAAGAEDAAIELGFKLPFNAFLGRTVTVDGNLQLRTKRRKPIDMVGVLVGDQDARESFRGAANGCQTLADLTQTEAGIDENAGFGGLQVGTITAGAAAENRELNGHSLTVVAGVVRGNIFCGKLAWRVEKSGRLSAWFSIIKRRLSALGFRNSSNAVRMKAKIRPLLA